jgi:hypothetical protein
MTITVSIYTDGPLLGVEWSQIRQGWEDAWAQGYSSLGPLAFGEPRNLKDPTVFASLPPASQAAAEVRNPDLLFVAAEGSVELGGLEVTDHSPDGSNIEKRYPFLWAARRSRLFAAVLTPYQKRRPTGAINRLPHRAARRNLKVAEEWEEDQDGASLTQILPLSSFQSGLGKVPDPVRRELWDLSEVGALFAHRLALAVAKGSEETRAKANLADAKRRLIALHSACQAATKNTSASTLFVDAERVIQTYNARPESGHWERGEGQFDSIDGRLMVTLDDLELFEPELSTKPFEFWLPQLARGHPWIKEQEIRGFKSKRLRNILVTLDGLVQTRFSDELTQRDWEILQQNPRLCLERDDRWLAGLYRVGEAFAATDLTAIAGTGLARVPAGRKAEIASVLAEESLFYGSFRCYQPTWREQLEGALGRVPSGSTVLLPRIPKVMAPAPPAAVIVKFAEDCTKAELMALRQLHRSSLAHPRPY